MSILYPATFTQYFDYVDGYFVIEFRDVPEAITQGVHFKTSIEDANDALKTAMEFYTERGEDYPVPSKPQQGDIMIEFIDPNSKPEDFIINYTHRNIQNVYPSE